RNVGTFLMVRWPTSFIASAVSRISMISSGSRSEMPGRCLCFTALLLSFQHDFVRAVELAQLDLHAFLARRRHVLADVIGLDRQFAMAAIDEHHELNRSGAAEI